jgi:hypothetical protein
LPLIEKLNRVKNFAYNSTVVFTIRGGFDMQQLPLDGTPRQLLREAKGRQAGQ